LGEFRSGSHSYIISNRLAEAISAADTEPTLIPFDDWLGLIAMGQTHRDIKIARLVKSVVAQASRSHENSEVDSNIDN
jgi:hypothetical protein